MTEALQARLKQLSEIQREAANFQEGAALVLAGPGAGKTGVLTARISRLLHDSQPRKFKVLALTFTTKAANEMSERVAALAPDLVERTYIGTFHAFCATIIRQHGSHIDVRPDFGIYDQDADRLALLLDAVRAAGIDPASAEQLLPTIDRLKQNLVVPEKTAERFSDKTLGEHVARVFSAYEARMRQENLMDFHGLILETCRLVRKFPAIGSRLKQTYPFWLIDEFQDTSPAQYMMLRAWAGTDFNNIFAVADDDQIIYQWAGASYRQLEKFREHFKPSQIQLVENHRCPESVVKAANKLVANNTHRTPNKKPLVATRVDGAYPIAIVNWDTDADELAGISGLIARQDPSTRPQTAVIARTRAQLAEMLNALRKVDIKAVVAERRSRFVSPQFVWLHTSLELAMRPADRRLFLVFGAAAERLIAAKLPTEAILDEANAGGKGLLEFWASRALASDDLTAQALGGFASRLVNARAQWRNALPKLIETLCVVGMTGGAVALDVEEDLAAWRMVEGEIKREMGGDPDISEFVQGLALRSKLPPPHPDAVSLMTVHASKGLEFDHVYVMGLAEGVFPSFQSVEKGATSPEIEEERRSCFVAVTRTKKTLTVSYAGKYRGYSKAPSRFLAEMGWS